MIDTRTDSKFMALALQAARNAGQQGEVPVGAVLVDKTGTVIAVEGNAPIGHHDPTAHAEIRAIRSAGRHLGNYRLPGTTLYVSLEPCAMCAGAIAHARIDRVVIAARDPKGGAVWHGPKFFDQPTCHWHPIVDHGPFCDEAGQILTAFFKARRRAPPDKSQA